MSKLFKSFVWFVLVLVIWAFPAYAVYNNYHVMYTFADELQFLGFIFSVIFAGTLNVLLNDWKWLR